MEERAIVEEPLDAGRGGDSGIAATSEISIAADRDAVWSLLTDFGRWPSWNREVRSVEADGQPVEGMTFRWKAGPMRIVSTIRRLRAPRFLSWTGRTIGIRAVHLWSLESSGGRTTVRTREIWHGPLVRLMRGAMQKTLQKSLDSGLRSLKEACERVADRQATATPSGRSAGP